MDTVSIVSLIFSVIALVGLGLSIRYYARQARAAAQAQFEESSITISNAFLQYPQLRPVFYDKKPVECLVADDRQRAETIAELLLDIFVFVLELEKHFKTKELAAGWKPYMQELFRTSPFLQDRLELRREWYPSLLAFVPQPARAAG